MTLKLGIEPCDGNVIKQAVILAAGSSITENDTVRISGSYKVHLWKMSDSSSTLVLLQYKKKFIGISKRKGSYAAIRSYYQAKMQAAKTVH